MDKLKKIKDNPSIAEIYKQIEIVDTLSRSKLSPIIRKIFPKTEEVFNDFSKINKQAQIFEVPDKFNDYFSKLGWIAYESMSLEIMQKAIQLADSEGLDSAEKLLANYYDDKAIESGILRLRGDTEFKRRIRLIELAKEDYLAERYHACIPLLLSLLDGIVNDISKHVGFFAESADMTAWDSIAGHETGLHVLASLFAKSRNKTNEDEITIPFRNGILHGRELAFDNKLVAAKSWAALFAIKDWSNALNNEPQTIKEHISWSELLKKTVQNSKERKLVDSWRPRAMKATPHLPNSGPANDLPQYTPEKAVAEFIESWIKKNYGALSEALFYPANKTKGEKAGLARKDFGQHTPHSYKILSFQDKSAAQSLIDVELTFNTNNQMVVKNINVLVNYVDSNNMPLVRTQENGGWKVMKSSFSDIIYTPSLI